VHDARRRGQCRSSRLHPALSQHALNARKDRDEGGRDRRHRPETSGIPYTVIRATQFLEFLGGIAASSTDGNTVRLSPGLFQPIAADDVAALVAEVALTAPRNAIVEIAGPERAPFNDIVARYLKAIGDPRQVVSDPEARYFGGRVERLSLVPLGEARLGRIDLDEWLRRSRARA
jgi:uncharacterized protein YbjT (DUF2867 family)